MAMTTDPIINEVYMAAIAWAVGAWALLLAQCLLLLLSASAREASNAIIKRYGQYFLILIIISISMIWPFIAIVSFVSLVNNLLDRVFGD